MLSLDRIERAAGGKVKRLSATYLLDNGKTGVVAYGTDYPNWKAANALAKAFNKLLSERMKTNERKDAL